MRKLTPWPWAVSQTKDGVLQIRGMVAGVSTPILTAVGTDQDSGNVELAAKAPDMLEILALLVQEVDDGGKVESGTISRARSLVMNLLHT